jgi:hypothetical protein
MENKNVENFDLCQNLIMFFASFKSLVSLVKVKQDYIELSFHNF